ncbi:MAG: hypothetical protein JOZ75_13695 [Candidatus Dormibacteraeota bacterium]|nr:hypothetical protein [Candidatus Dormibacteraeota bacterium]
MALLDSLEALVSERSDRGSPLRSYLQSGLSDEEIREAGQRDATLHPDVVALFGCLVTGDWIPEAGLG